MIPGTRKHGGDELVMRGLRPGPAVTAASDNLVVNKWWSVTDRRLYMCKLEFTCPSQSSVSHLFHAAQNEFPGETPPRKLLRLYTSHGWRLQSIAGLLLVPSVSKLGSKLFFVNMWALQWPSDKPK